MSGLVPAIPSSDGTRGGPPRYDARSVGRLELSTRLHLAMVVSCDFGVTLEHEDVEMTLGTTAV